MPWYDSAELQWDKFVLPDSPMKRWEHRAEESYHALVRRAPECRMGNEYLGFLCLMNDVGLKELPNTFAIKVLNNSKVAYIVPELDSPVRFLSLDGEVYFEGLWRDTTSALLRDEGFFVGICPVPQRKPEGAKLAALPAD